MFFQSQASPTEKSQKKPDFVWLFSFPKQAKGVQKRQNSKSGFKKAKLATLNPSINDASTTTTAICLSQFLL